MELTMTQLANEIAQLEAQVQSFKDELIAAHEHRDGKRFIKAKSAMGTHCMLIGELKAQYQIRSEKGEQ